MAVFRVTTFVGKDRSHTGIWTNRWFTDQDGATSKEEGGGLEHPSKLGQSAQVDRFDLKLESNLVMFLNEAQSHPAAFPADETIAGIFAKDADKGKAKSPVRRRRNAS